MRRWKFAALVAAAALLTGCFARGRFDQPQTDGFAPAGTVLHDGTPASVGLDPAPIDAALATVHACTEVCALSQAGKPMVAGAVTLFVHDGVIVTRDAYGYALRYSDANFTELPPAQRVPMRTDTIFDMASVTKLFTTIIVMQLAEQGVLDVDAPVAPYLPEFGVNGKAGITIKQMLTHTSGLVPTLELWRDYPNKAARIKAVMDVTPINPPGTAYVYSDLNLITLGVLAERMTGKPLDVLVRERVTQPLHMVDTGYNPSPALIGRIAATEDVEYTNPPRGIVRGQVHDENANSFGGVAGHAGIFSTADDMAIIGQMLLNGGIYDGHRILSEATVKEMLVNYNTQFPQDSHGLGFELNQRWYMDALSGPRTAGHTGFTGPDIVLDFASRSIVVFMSNRIHPTRDVGSNSGLRRAVAHGLGLALAVPHRHDNEEWYADIPEASTASLQVAQPLAARRGSLVVDFDAFVDVDAVDSLTLEVSVDGGATWRAVPVAATGPGAPQGTVTTLSASGHRSWWQVHAALADIGPGRPVRLRWRYSTGAKSLFGRARLEDPNAPMRAGVGRGVFLDGITVSDNLGVLLDGGSHPEAFSPTSFRLTTR